MGGVLLGLSGIGWQSEKVGKLKTATQCGWMRKAALLSEAGREEESESLTLRAIAGIGRIPVDDHSVAGPSREGWALWSTIVLRIDKRYSIDGATWRHKNVTLTQKRPKLPVHWRLATARVIRQILILVHEIRRALDSGLEGAFQFRKAYRAIRLSEIAGIPVATPDASPRRANAADLVQTAAERLVVFDTELAARLVLQASTYDKDKALMRVLSRHSIALMPGRGGAETGCGLHKID